MALLSRDAPILLVCMARPELSERRAGWPVTLRLQPLEAEPVSALLPDTLPQAVRERIAHSAAGNPLFLIEMTALAREGEGELSVPASLRALLSARLDQLSPEERHLLQCASVEGERKEESGRNSAVTKFPRTDSTRACAAGLSESG